MAGATVVFAAMTFMAGQSHIFEWLCLVLFTAGAAWIGILACFNLVAQTMCPSWVLARSLSMYVLVLQGGMAAGSAVWGALASSRGIPSALLYAAIALLLGLITMKWYRLRAWQTDLVRFADAGITQG